MRVSVSLRLPMSVGAAQKPAAGAGAGAGAGSDAAGAAAVPASEFAEAARVLKDEPPSSGPSGAARPEGPGGSRASGASPAEGRVRAAFERADKPVKVVRLRTVFLDAGITTRIPQVRLSLCERARRGPPAGAQYARRAS